MKFIFKKSDNISKDEIVEAIKQNPLFLSGKIKFINYNTKRLTKSDWDLIGVDENKHSVFILIKTRYYDQLLFEIFNLFEWTINNLKIFEQLFSQNEIDTGLQSRIIIVAPLYSAAFKNIISHCTKLNIELFSYKGLENEEGRGVLIEREENEDGGSELKLNKNLINNLGDLEQLAELTEEEVSAFFK